MDALFLQILSMSITTSYVIICVIVIRFLLKKVPKLFSYALWAVVFIRMICPISFESILSIVPVSNKAVTREIQIGRPSAHHDNSTLGVRERTNSVETSNEFISAKPTQSWSTVVGYIWFAGVVILLIYNILKMIRLNRSLQYKKCISDNIYELDADGIPFVLGLIKPRIYLPAGLSEEEREYILKHEQLHIERRDYIIKPIAFFIVCIHWFNPLAWAAFCLMSEDMELSCDESVIKKYGAEIKKKYAATLLKLSTRRLSFVGAPLAFGENNTKNRIKNVLQYKKPRIRLMIAIAFIMILAAIALLSNPKEISQEQDYKHRMEASLNTAAYSAVEEKQDEPEKMDRKQEAVSTYSEEKVNFTDEKDNANSTYEKDKANSTYKKNKANSTYEKDKADSTYEKEKTDSTYEKVASGNGEEIIIENIGSVLWYFRKYQGSDTKLLNNFDRYEIVREDGNPETASLKVIEDNIWTAWNRWDNILNTIDRFIYIAAKEGEDENVVSPVLVSIGWDGSNRKEYEVPYNTINQLTMDDTTEKIYFTGWTKDQTFPQPFYETDKDLVNATVKLQLNGWLITVYKGYAYYISADKKQPGIYRVAVIGAAEPEFCDKIDLIAENEAPFISSEVKADSSGAEEIAYLIRTQDGDFEGNIPISQLIGQKNRGYPLSLTTFGAPTFSVSEAHNN